MMPFFHGYCGNVGKKSGLALQELIHSCVSWKNGKISLGGEPMPKFFGLSSQQKKIKGA